MVRVMLIDDGKPHDVFDVIGVDSGVVRARTAYLFEVGEELSVRVEEDGKAAYETGARVRGHVGASDALVTELELEPKP